jgi:hypothetical protein
LPCSRGYGTLGPCIWSAEQLDIAARIDAKVRRLIAEGADDIATFAEMSDDMPAFKRLLDSGHPTMDALCLRFGGFYRYAKMLEMIAAGIASGEIRAPK